MRDGVQDVDYGPVLDIGRNNLQAEQRKEHHPDRYQQEVGKGQASLLPCCQCHHHFLLDQLTDNPMRLKSACLRFSQFIQITNAFPTISLSCTNPQYRLSWLSSR